MVTKIEVWQIENEKLVQLNTTMVQAGRKEVNDLQKWILSCPEILGSDIRIIGSQVRTDSGRQIDLLGMDKMGNPVVIELKRDIVPREALAQAIDYASEIALWDFEKFDEVCMKHRNQSLYDVLVKELRNEDPSVNQTQRILLVGTSIEDSLQRMIEWLSNKFNMIINIISVRYIQTKKGEEFLAKSVMIPESVELERAQKQQRKIPMSDVKGDYDQMELKKRMSEYLLEGRVTPKRIRDILIPLCLENERVSRELLIQELMKKESIPESTARIVVTTISRELGIKERDYLRQVIHYEIPEPGSRDKYSIPEKYRQMVEDIQREMSSS